MEIIVFYFVFALLTWASAGYATGCEFEKARRHVQPGQQLSVNWFNIFYQGLAWPAYWGSRVGEWHTKRMGR